jgi:cobalt-precorrin 5A hydrolase
VNSTFVASTFVAGFGFRAHATCEALQQVLTQALRTAELGQPAPVVLAALASAEDKCSHPALVQLAFERGLPVHPVALALLAAQDLPPSQHVPARYGSHSLAEAAALAAAGQGAVLVAPRQVSADGSATAAIATTNTTTALNPSQPPNP